LAPKFGILINPFIYIFQNFGLLQLSCKQQIIALSKVRNINNTNVLEQEIVVFSLVATTHLQP
jgi:hypothetical protein